MAAGCCFYGFWLLLLLLLLFLRLILLFPVLVVVVSVSCCLGDGCLFGSGRFANLQLEDMGRLKRLFVWRHGLALYFAGTVRQRYRESRLWRNPPPNPAATTVDTSCNI